MSQKEAEAIFNLGIAIFEGKLTNEQVQYLHQYYTMNRSPGPQQILQIAKQWNINDFDFFVGLIDWFDDWNLVQIEPQQRRYFASRSGA